MLTDSFFFFFCSTAPGQVSCDQAGLGRGKVGGRGQGRVPWFGGSNAGPPSGKSARRTDSLFIVAQFSVSCCVTKHTSFFFFFFSLYAYLPFCIMCRTMEPFVRFVEMFLDTADAELLGLPADDGVSVLVNSPLRS